MLDQMRSPHNCHSRSGFSSSQVSASSASQNTSQTPGKVCVSNTIAPTGRPLKQRPTRSSSSRSFVVGLFIPRAREPEANDKAGRSRDRQFTRIVTYLYNVVSSAFRGFAPSSSRSSSDFGHLARCLLQSLSEHHCNVPRVSLQLGSARCGISSDHMVQERSFHRGVAIRMELPRVRFPSYFENKTPSNHFSL